MGLPFPFRTVLAVSSILRIVLIIYSEWHDRHSVVKYTDIDYRVFTDAAGFLLRPSATNTAQGPLLPFLERTFGLALEVGNPYKRDTYRYTPLLALLLTPNQWFPSFGKYVFALCDILNGVLIYRMVSLTVEGDKSSEKVPRTSTHSEKKDAIASATFCASIHLLNPLVFSISTRGSSESILSLFVLLTLSAALKRQWNRAAILLGLSTHWKIYPLIYGVSCVTVISSEMQNPGSGYRKYVRTLFNYHTIKFGLTAASTFLALGAGCYLVWGYPFLYESYLYHLHRLDHRHNFSPYFYLTYLTYPSAAAASTRLPSFWIRLLRSPLSSFVPQMSLAFGTGLVFGRKGQDLPFAWFVQTVVFVLFNKVCTSQVYFLWYLLLLPLLLPHLSTSGRRATVYIGVWAGTQALWLAEAYKLEFLGENVFFQLWLKSLVYVVGNVWVLAGIMGDYKAQLS